MSRHASAVPAQAIQVAERETAYRNQLALKAYQAGRGVSQPRSSRTAGDPAAASTSPTRVPTPRLRRQTHPEPEPGTELEAG
jgi:hypothetical protein